MIDYNSFIFTETNPEKHDDVTFVAPNKHVFFELKIKFICKSVSVAQQCFTMKFCCTFYLYLHKTGTSYNLDTALGHIARI